MAVVEGRHENKLGEVVFKTFGTLTQKSNLEYDFGIYLEGKYKGQYSAKIDGAKKTLIWQREVPLSDGASGLARYSVEIQDNVWFEIGEFSRNKGQTWVKTFEMTLNKTADSCTGFE